MPLFFNMRCIVVKVFAAFLVLPILAIASQMSLAEVQRAVVFVAVESSPFERSYGADSSWCDSYRSFYNYFWPPELAHGSGFIMSPEGHVITNDHVVEDATTVLVIMRAPDLKLCKATVLGRDPRCDLAVLKLEMEETTSLPYLTLGDSDLVEIGEQVFRMGNPKMFDSSVSVGAISGKDRNFFGWLPIEGYLQTDAGSYDGNSGGPIVNSKGEVIGVSCMGLGYFEGLNLDVPSNTVKEIARQIIANGKITQGFLGIRLEKNELVAFDWYTFDHHKGALVKSLIKNSPAEKAGLKQGDFIIKFNNRAIQSSADLRNKVAVLAEETAISLTVEREGEVLEFTLELGSDELSKWYSNLEGVIITI